jgi:hypothetical protein
LQGFIEIANITRHLFIYDFWHKRICKGSSLQKGKILLTFVEIWAPNFWEIIYCPNHCLIITNTQQKTFCFLFCNFQINRTKVIEFRVISIAAN